MAVGQVAAVGEPCASRRFEVWMSDRRVRRRACPSYKNRTRITAPLPPAASRCIVRYYGYAAGALISLALSLGRAQPLSAGSGSPPWETRCCPPVPGLSRLRNTRFRRSVGRLRGRYSALGLWPDVLARV